MRIPAVSRCHSLLLENHAVRRKVKGRQDVGGKLGRRNVKVPKLDVEGLNPFARFNLCQGSILAVLPAVQDS